MLNTGLTGAILAVYGKELGATGVGLGLVVASY